MSSLVVTMCYTLNRRMDSDLHLIKRTKARSEKEPARLSAGQNAPGKGSSCRKASRWAKDWPKGPTA